MPTVKFPTEHFTNNVRRFYQNPDVALIREFLQNSVDAGAKNISFDFHEDAMVVGDDGCGMTKDIIENALLTMSGTHKGHGAIGGFGAAKEILLFQHECYQITTGSLKVNGHQLSYDITDNTKTVVGTHISLFFHDNYKYIKGIMIDKARNYLESCDVKATIILNHSIIKSKNVVSEDDLFKDLGWCKVYVKKTNKKHDYVSIRMNGVEMFRKFVSDVSSKIVIELSVLSTEILTVSRDSFNYTYDNQLSGLLNDITINKNSFGTMLNKSIVVKGKNDFVSTISKISEQIKNVPKEEQDVIMAKVNNCSNNDCAVNELKNFIKEVSGIDIVTSVDFHIDCEKNINKIPNYLHPSTMSERKNTIAKLWKRCLKLVMEHNNLGLNFTIGWIISDHTEAQHTTFNGVHVFKLNPEFPWLKGSTHKNVWLKMIMIAAHEVAHVKCKYHDEYFVLHYDELLMKTLTNVDSWWNEYLDAKANEYI